MLLLERGEKQGGHESVLKGGANTRLGALFDITKGCLRLTCDGIVNWLYFLTHSF